jgi:hypothetical protein
MALCFALLVCGGCSLFLSTSDLSDANGTDAGATDGPPPVVDEAGRDSAPAGDAGGRFCQSLSPAPKHCADFDDGNLLSFFDDVQREPTPTTASVAPDEGGVRAAIANADGCSYARLTKTVPSSGAGMRIRFNVMPVAPWPKDQIFFFLKLEDGAGECGFLLHLDGEGAGGQLHVQWGDPEQDDGVDWTELPKVGAWSEMGIELAAANPPTVTVSVDGKKAMSQAFPQCTFGTGVYVAMGLHCASGTAAVRYDDVVIDYP